MLLLLLFGQPLCAWLSSGTQEVCRSWYGYDYDLIGFFLNIVLISNEIRRTVV